MGLKEEIADWRQPDGLVVPKSERPGIEGQDTTGDGIKHFCLYHALLVKRGESRPEDFAEFERVIRDCFVRSGLPHRSPTKIGEQISKDALMAIGYAGKLLRSRVAWEVLNCGNRSRFLWFKWFYPNLFPEYFDRGAKKPLSLIFSKRFWQAWRGMNPEVVCHIQYCGLPPGHEPHLIRRIWLWIFFLVTSVKKGSVYSLAYMAAESARGHSSVGDFFIHLWEDRMERAGGIVKRLTEEYEPNHPIVRYWR